MNAPTPPEFLTPADLGIDAIWLTPCFPSPQHDHGYDVADYFDIEPQHDSPYMLIVAPVIQHFSAPMFR